jgi:predicted nuclease of restriction endonuclease-like (RecB) superfamily
MSPSKIVKYSESNDLARVRTKPFEALLSDVRQIIENGLQKAYQGVDFVMVHTYWLVGQRIVVEEQNGEARAEYGSKLLENLATELSREYATSYTARDLRNYRQLYLYFNDLENWHACVPNLSWTHFRSLLRVVDENARYWYLREASKEMWSTRALDRNIGSQYYHRLLQAPTKDAVIAEMQKLIAPLQTDKNEFIKNPVVAEFLQLPSNTNFTETELERAIIKHIKEFLLEMGRGFAFMSEQYHIATDVGDYYVDLVFYNVVLKCYFLVDLKTTTISHQDVGQMDMYIRMFDDLRRTEGDNPTIGLLLCAETSKDVARYSILNDNKQLYAAKYLTFMPTEEELAREIERQKEIFQLQHEK